MSRAATKLFVTQPTMSRQLKDLEEELGVQLFVRTNYSIRLTEAGERFYRRAKDILQLVAQTKQEFQAQQQDSYNDLCIGCPESESIKYVAQTIKLLRAQGINIRVHLHSGNAATVLERLNGGLDEMALILRDIDAVRYHVLQLPLSDKWGVIMLPNHPLATKEQLCITDLITQPLIISQQAYEQELPLWYGDKLSKLNIVATYNLIYNAAMFVREGVGIAITLDHLVTMHHSLQELVFRPLTGVPSSLLKLIWRKNSPLSKSGAIFLQTLQQCLAHESLVADDLRMTDVSENN